MPYVCTDCDDYCSGGCKLGCSTSCTSCKGNCVDTCLGDCQSGCSGCGTACSSSCTGCSGCGGCDYGCSGCGDACSSSCTGCSGCGGCDNGCSSTCKSGCKTYCNSGCSGKAMADVYARLNLSTRIEGTEITDVRTLLLHELDRFGLTIVKAAKTDTNSGTKIQFGEIVESVPTHTGIELVTNIQALKSVANALTNGILSRQEMITCIEYLKTSYDTKIKYSGSPGTAGVTRRADGTTITETSYDPWSL